METEAAAGAHNNHPTNGRDMATETAFVAVAAATVAADSKGVKTEVMAETAARAAVVAEAPISRSGDGSCGHCATAAVAAAAAMVE